MHGLMLRVLYVSWVPCHALFLCFVYPLCIPSVQHALWAWPFPHAMHNFPMHAELWCGCEHGWRGGYLPGLCLGASSGQDQRVAGAA